MYKEGLLEQNNISNLERTTDFNTDFDKLDTLDETQYKFSIRYYNKTSTIFPSAMEALRLGLGRHPAVNFPPLTAKFVYLHIQTTLKTKMISPYMIQVQVGEEEYLVP